MPSNNPRVNVTFEESTVALLIKLAKKRNLSVSSLVREFTIDALEKHEDFYLSKIAQNIDHEEAPRYDHKTAWK